MVLLLHVCFFAPVCKPYSVSVASTYSNGTNLHQRLFTAWWMSSRKSKPWVESWWLWGMARNTLHSSSLTESRSRPKCTEILRPRHSRSSICPVSACLRYGVCHNGSVFPVADTYHMRAASKHMAMSTLVWTLEAADTVDTTAADINRVWAIVTHTSRSAPY